MQCCLSALILPIISAVIHYEMLPEFVDLLIISAVIHYAMLPEYVDLPIISAVILYAMLPEYVHLPIISTVILYAMLPEYVHLPIISAAAHSANFTVLPGNSDFHSGRVNQALSAAMRTLLKVDFYCMPIQRRT